MSVITGEYLRVTHIRNPKERNENHWGDPVCDWGPKARPCNAKEPYGQQGTHLN